MLKILAQLKLAFEDGTLLTSFASNVVQEGGTPQRKGRKKLKRGRRPMLAVGEFGLKEAGMFTNKMSLFQIRVHGS